MSLQQQKRKIVSETVKDEFKLGINNDKDKNSSSSSSNSSSSFGVIEQED